MSLFMKFQRLEAAQMQRLEAASGHQSQYSCDAALARKSVHKNRYRDILPFDSNRVKLRSNPDYINASYIDNGYAKWIAAQGPLDSTIVDFWQMIIEQSSLIVMLCGVQENGRSKCAPYWPVDLRQNAIFTDSGTERSVSIRCYDLSIDAVSDAILRDLEVRFETSGKVVTKIVKHIHFDSWPDHDVTTIEKILELIRRTISLSKQDKSEECVTIHCSAGCGRTGTFIALHSLLQNPSQDLAELVDMLRKQRISSVQSFSQFSLLQDYINDQSFSQRDEKGFN